MNLRPKRPLIYGWTITLLRPRLCWRHSFFPRATWRQPDMPDVKQDDVDRILAALAGKEDRHG